MVSEDQREAEARIYNMERGGWPGCLKSRVGDTCSNGWSDCQRAGALEVRGATCQVKEDTWA